MPHSTINELKQLGIGKKIRNLRESRNWTQDEMAAKLGLSKVLLGQIEEEVVPPTVATLLNISKLLSIGIDYFFTSDEFTGKIEVTRSNERLSVHHEDLAEAGRLTYNYESLAYRLPKKHMEPFFVEFDESEQLGDELTHDGEEFVHVLEGSLELKIGDDLVVLEAGDSMYFYADVPHAIRGIGPGKHKAIIVLYPFES